MRTCGHFERCRPGPGSRMRSSDAAAPRRGNSKPDSEHRRMTTTQATAKQIVDHHLAAFFERDLDGILSDYAPDAVLFTANGPLRGVGQIRPLFEALVAEFGKPGAAF